MFPRDQIQALCFWYEYNRREVVSSVYHLRHMTSICPITDCVNFDLNFGYGGICQCSLLKCYYVYICN